MIGRREPWNPYSLFCLLYHVYVGIVITLFSQIPMWVHWFIIDFSHCFNLSHAFASKKLKFHVFSTWHQITLRSHGMKGSYKTEIPLNLCILIFGYLVQNKFLSFNFVKLHNPMSSFTSSVFLGNLNHLIYSRLGREPWCWNY